MSLSLSLPFSVCAIIIIITIVIIVIIILLLTVWCGVSSLLLLCFFSFFVDEPVSRLAPTPLHHTRRTVSLCVEPSLQDARPFLFSIVDYKYKHIYSLFSFSAVAAFRVRVSARVLSSFDR